MPRYEYKCDHCSHVTTKSERIANRDRVIDCEQCGAVARYQICVSGVQIIGRPSWLADENRYWMGGSATEQKAQQAQDVKDYERNLKPVGPGPTNAKLL